MSGVVSWAETDASGRFHFTAPWRWVEDTEHALLRSAVPGIDIARFPRRATEAVYHRALFAGDQYDVHLSVDRLGRTSIRFTWQVRSGHHVCLQGAHTVVHVSDAGEPTTIPTALRAALAASREEPA